MFVFVDNGEIFRKCHHVRHASQVTLLSHNCLECCIVPSVQKILLFRIMGGGAGFKKIMILEIPLPELLQNIKICCCFAPFLKRKKVLEF